MFFFLISKGYESAFNIISKSKEFELGLLGSTYLFVNTQILQRLANFLHSGC